MVPLANAALSAAQIDEALAALAPTTSVLLTQLETPSALTAHITARGREHGDDGHPRPGTGRRARCGDLAEHRHRHPNETEATLISGIEVTDAASAERRTLVPRPGVGAAVITLAGQGSCVVTAEGASVTPPFPVEAVDTTAAGDAYAGYLGAALANGSTLADAVRLATAAGALTVTKQGASPSLPHRAPRSMRS